MLVPSRASQETSELYLLWYLSYLGHFFSPGGEFSNIRDIILRALEKNTDLTPCLVTVLRSCSPHAYWMHPSGCTCCFRWLCWLSEMKKDRCFAQSLNSQGVYLRCIANLYHSPHNGVGEGPGMALGTLLELLKQNEKDLTRPKTRLTFESLD